MNEYQDTLYQDLMNLVSTNEAFYFVDQEMDGDSWRVFSYRLASYSDFLAPNALECRGHMFRTKGDEAVALASLPAPKFFNLNECPFTMNLDLSKTLMIMNKEDGSLISTYLTNKGLRLKSKASLHSQQAIDAMEWLSKNPALKGELQEIAEEGYTLNFEWVAPWNRIVLEYTEPRLILLNVRNNETGEYLSRNDPLLRWISDLWVDTVSTDDPAAFADSISTMIGIEGFVFVLPDQLVKIKCNQYCSLHSALNEVNTSKKVAICVIEEGIDDLYALFKDNSETLSYMEDIECKVTAKFNHMIKTAEHFHQDNKELSRKDYAIKAQSMKDGYMSLYMNLYSGKEPDYKQFAIKNIDSFLG